ncbi:hypothetical protein ACE1OC_43045 (plasmid) [Streptomyces sp. DSM 116496]|uniref:hypothetical protein n=1 Tax=Streptomyces stoeckheimensis TaxID=3344656 RepID=UPI0038B361E5
MIARFGLDRGTLRAAGFVALMTVVFLTVNTAVAAAADGTGDAAGEGLLGPLNIASSEGVPLDGYELGADGGTALNVVGQFQVLVLGGLFSLARLLVGLSGWLVDFVFDFPLLRLLADPAQDLADTYNTHVVGALGLKGLLLGWAFIFGGIVFMRGKAGTGLGEIILTLVIAAFAASAFIRPDYLLGQDGPLNQAHEAAIEVAQITTRSYFGEDGAGVCAAAVGPMRDTCYREEAQGTGVVQPIQDALTDALVVKPYMLLQYGTVLDPKDPADKAAYEVHLKWVAKLDRGKPGTGKGNQCRKIKGPARNYCLGMKPPPIGLTPQDPTEMPWDRNTADPEFMKMLADLEKAGERGKEAAAYAKEPSWDRVGAALLLLVAVVVIALMVMSMVLVMFGAQAGDAAAAACGGVAWVWAMLPGPSRMALWRWFGVFVVSVMVSFVAAMTLPLFGITVHVVFSRSGPDLMVERLLLLDAIAVAFLVFHRRMMAAASTFGQRMTTRMRFAKIGGSHLRGDNSEFGAALAVHGPRPGAGTFGIGGSAPAHSAFGARLRSMGSLAALTDPAGLPFAPGRAIGDALAEGRRGIAPLALALRGAHSLLVGPPPARHPAANTLQQAPGGQPHPAGEVQVDQQTGEVLHDPATDRPLLGSRIHHGASRLRGYRVAHRAGRVAYGATMGLPRTLHAARTTTSEFTQDALTQLRVTRSHLSDDAFAWGQTGRAVRDGVDHAGQRLATAWQVHDPASTVRAAAVAAAIHTAPLTAASRTPRPPTTYSAPPTPGGHRVDPVPWARPDVAPHPAVPSHMHRPGPPLRRTGEPRTGTAPSRSVRAADPAAEANAARLRAIFEARAAERRRREGEGEGP